MPNPPYGITNHTILQQDSRNSYFSSGTMTNLHCTFSQIQQQSRTSMDTTFHNANRILYESNWYHYYISSTNRHCHKSTNLYHLRANSYFCNNPKPMEKTYEFHKRVSKFVLWTQCAHDLIHPALISQDRPSNAQTQNVHRHSCCFHPPTQRNTWTIQRTCCVLPNFKNGTSTCHDR